MKVHLQTEFYNCGIWVVFLAAGYAEALIQHYRQAAADNFEFTISNDLVLQQAPTAEQRQRNKEFADNLRAL
jgi:hypothetical protein